jgi:cysteine desulfurase/selenocysteine lyase
LAYELVAQIPGVRILGPAATKRSGLITFVVEGQAAADVAWRLDGFGIAVRAGHHCAMPLHQQLGLPASCRASFYLYNTRDEVEQFAAALAKIVRG